MKIGLQTWGTEGDIRPFFALAAALAGRGHAVKLAYTSVEGRDFTALARGCGIDAESVGCEYFRARPEALAALAMNNMADTNPLRQVRRILDALMDPVADAMFAAAERIAGESDVMIGHFLSHTTVTAAMHHGRPHGIVTLQPVLPSSHYPPLGMPSLGRWLNPLLWRVAGRVLDAMLIERVNRVRARTRVPPLKSVLGEAHAELAVSVMAVSPALFTRPSDWDDRLVLTGFLSLPESSEPWRPSPEMQAFLDAGAPPVFLSFGSMMTFGGSIADESVALFAEAARIADVRAVIQCEPSVAARAPTSDRVHYFDRAPHAQLFPRCAAIVHHGGAGTTQSALRAGRPSVVVPHAADQFFWGDLLHARQVGARPVLRKSLTAKNLAARLRDALGNPELRANAEALGRVLALEDGPARAAEAIEAALR